MPRIHTHTHTLTGVDAPLLELCPSSSVTCIQKRQVHIINTKNNKLMIKGTLTHDHMHAFGCNSGILAGVLFGLFAIPYSKKNAWLNHVYALFCDCLLHHGADLFTRIFLPASGRLSDLTNEL